MAAITRIIRSEVTDLLMQRMDLIRETPVKYGTQDAQLKNKKNRRLLCHCFGEYGLRKGVFQAAVQQKVTLT